MHKKEVTALWYGLLAVLSLIIIIFLKSTSTPVGFAVQSAPEMEHQWNFSSTGDYSYNSSLAVQPNLVQLTPFEITTSWNTTATTAYSLQKAWYHPSDKTDKVTVVDNKKLELNAGEVLDVVFSNPVDNSQFFSIYIEEGSVGTMVLCDPGTICSSPGYGSVSYDGNSGWYNITITNLPHPLKTFTLSTPTIKINALTSSSANIVTVWHKADDMASKVSALDNDKQELNDNKLFNLVFDHTLSNDDTLSLYLMEGSATVLYLCPYGESCVSSNYGSVAYDGGTGWYNITLAGLSSPATSFNLHPDHTLKIDYLKAFHTEAELHSSTVIQYVAAAEIRTTDFQPGNLGSWNSFSREEELNGQSIEYYYSSDSGNNWQEIPLDLSALTSTTIKLKAVLNSKGTATPTLKKMILSYTTLLCLEDWECTAWSPATCPINETQARSCTDENSCGTTSDQPIETQSCTYVPACIEAWYHFLSSCLPSNLQLQFYLDQNECGTITQLPADHKQYRSCDYCADHNCSGSYGSEVTWQDGLTVDARNQTNTMVELNAGTVEYGYFSLVEYTHNLRNETPPGRALRRYVTINFNQSVAATTDLKLYYTESEVAVENIDESTLQLYHYNETAQQWVRLDSAVNSTGNFISAAGVQLGLVGIVGQELVPASPETSSSSSSGGGGSSGGSSRSRTLTATTATQSEIATATAPISSAATTTPPIEITETNILLETSCVPQVEISLPRPTLFADNDFIVGEIFNKGDCELRNLSLSVDASLESVLDFAPTLVEPMLPHSSLNFTLIRKQEFQRPWLNLFTGLGIAEVVATQYLPGVLTVTGNSPSKIVTQEVPLQIELIFPEKMKASVQVFFFSMVSLLLAVILLFLLWHRKNPKRL